MNPIISIIIPVYKVEPYIHKCLDSVCAQTYQNLDIILVDDGSPDTCGSICDEYAARDSRIRVIHKENGGLSSARNAGMAIARGDFIGFVDSDDWIEPDMFELLYRNMAAENAAISVCGHYQHENEKFSACGDSSYAVLSPREAIESVYCRNGFAIVVWNKLFRKELFCNLCFPEGRIYEDAFIIFQLLDAAQKIVIDMKPKYHYLCRPGSIMTSPLCPAQLDILDATLQNYDFLCEKYPELAHHALYACLWSRISMIMRVYRAKDPSYKAVECSCIRFIRQHYRVVLRDLPWSAARRMVAILLCICPPACKLIVGMHQTYRQSLMKN